MSVLGRRTMQTTFRISQQTLIVDLGSVRSVLSSAPRAGGMTRARYILNHQVAAKPVEKGIVAGVLARERAIQPEPSVVWLSR